VRRYHGEAAAQAARHHFERTIIHHEVPEELQAFYPVPAEGTRIPLPDLLRQAGLVGSNSEARRLIAQRAVSIDGQKVTDTHCVIDLEAQPLFVLKVGKRRFARIVWHGHG
jgi:tyrosyl-tRNA synthetase